MSKPFLDDANKTTYIPPKRDYESFIDDAHYTEKVKEWGLSTAKGKQFWYKEATFQLPVTLKGYEVYGKGEEYNTIIIEFEDGRLSCIHPAYLKEMQSPSFSKIVNTGIVETNLADKKTEALNNPETKETASEPKAKPAKEKKEKTQKIELPTDKVHFTAEVKQFALSWNHFNEENDEVVVLQNVVIEQDDPLELGLAWCSHSKTVKKFELSPGDKLDFDGKIVKKKLPSGKDVEEEFVVTEPVMFKINNPSKIKKS